MIHPDQLLPLIDFEKSKKDGVDFLCEPLVNIGISNFGYTRITRDGDFFRIGNCLAFTEMAHKNDWINSPLGFNGVLTDSVFDGDRKTIVSLWNVADNPLTQQRRLIDVWNGATFYMTNPNYLEVFSIGGTIEDTELPNFILNNINLMKKYFNYFKIQAGDLLDTSKKGLTVKVPFCETEDQQRQKVKDQIEAFNAKISDPKLSLGDKFVCFTQRELECLLHRNQGLSAKKMALIMGISYRTVESYLENVKIKSGLGNISQVLAICRDQGLL